MSDKSVPMDDTEYRLSVEIPDESIFEMKANRLAWAMGKINPEDKSLLLLKYQDGASIRELSELYEVGESAIKMRLKRAKARLVEIYNLHK